MNVTKRISEYGGQFVCEIEVRDFFNVFVISRIGKTEESALRNATEELELFESRYKEYLKSQK